MPVLSYKSLNLNPSLTANIEIPDTHVQICIAFPFMPTVCYVEILKSVPALFLHFKHWSFDWVDCSVGLFILKWFLCVMVLTFDNF